jgi:RimJ/RimL family protein N-acetyltransferase
MSAPALHPWEVPPEGPAAEVVAALAARLPVLETPRLVLRAPALADFDAYAAILCGPDTAHLGGPFDREAAWGDFCTYVAGWLLRGSGLWTVTLRDSGAVLGFVLVGMEYGDAEPELGYLFTEAAQGHGYATEAAAAARDHALDALALPSLVSYVAPEHDRSAAVARRLGARRDGAAERAFADDPVQVWRYAATGSGGAEAYA